MRLAHERSPARWGLALKERMKEYWWNTRTIESEVFADLLPNDGTYVDLDPDIRDRWGLPAARLHLQAPEHHRIVGRFLVDRGLQVLLAAGAKSVVPGEIGGTTAHLVHGTCRAGIDPEKSVLDRGCRMHEVSNLYGVDGSFLPTSGGVPTTLTIRANAFRVADHILGR